MRVRRIRAGASRWFGRHPFLSVTVARLVSFVRTVMPMAAGMSDLAYRRYLAYELPGVVAWCALYVMAGFAAGQGWRWATEALGLAGALALLGVLAGLSWLARRRRGATGGRRSLPEGTLGDALGGAHRHGRRRQVRSPPRRGRRPASPS